MEEIVTCPECTVEIQKNFTVREEMQFGTKIQCRCGHIWIVNSSVLRDKVPRDRRDTNPYIQTHEQSSLLEF